MNMSDTNNSTSDTTDKDTTPKPPKDKSQATLIVEMASAKGIELFHDTDKTGWATFKRDGHHEHWPIESRTFADYLGNLFFETKHRVAQSNSMQGAISQLRGYAVFKGKEHDLHLRVARIDDRI